MAERKVISVGGDAAADLPVQDASLALAADSLCPRPDLLVTEDFLEAEVCESLLRESRSADFRQAKFHRPPEGADAQLLLDTSTRNVKELIMFKETRALVAERLMAYKPVLEAHFEMKLGECQRPNFLYYTEGGHYVPHRDSADEPEYPDFVRQRRLSMVIFLNSQGVADKEADYRGGALVIYTPNYKVNSDEPGLHVLGKAGLLVAFPSNVYHQVEPVTAGERFTIASWFD